MVQAARISITGTQSMEDAEPQTLKLVTDGSYCYEPGYIRFSYVEKDIRSPVPPKALLPAEVQPFKVLLDEASGGRTGSPQGALIVNGVMHDYFFWHPHGGTDRRNDPVGAQRQARRIPVLPLPEGGSARARL